MRSSLFAFLLVVAAHSRSQEINRTSSEWLQPAELVVAEGSKCVSGSAGAVKGSFSRSLVGTGFHRVLVTNAALSWNSLSEHCLINQSPVDDGTDPMMVFELVAVDILPHGVYVDADEVMELERLQQFPLSSVHGISETDAEFGARTGRYMDVEAPSYAAVVSSLVEVERTVMTGVIVEVAQSLLSRSTGDLHINFSVPVHARYGTPSIIQKRANIGLRDTPHAWLLRCTTANQAAGPESWKEVCGMELDAAMTTVDWSIPVGDLQEESLVKLGTTLAALVVTGVLVREFFLAVR